MILNNLDTTANLAHNVKKTQTSIKLPFRLECPLLVDLSHLADRQGHVVPLRKEKYIQTVSAISFSIDILSNLLV